MTRIALSNIIFFPRRKESFLKTDANFTNRRFIFLVLKSQITIHWYMLVTKSKLAIKIFPFFFLIFFDIRVHTPYHDSPWICSNMLWKMQLAVERYTHSKNILK